MYGKFQKYLSDELKAIEEAGLYKKEREICSAQGAEITLADGSKALNFCANNYLGLSDNPRLIAAAKKAMDERGYGMSSVRFICGQQDLHRELEKAISEFFHTDDTILYAACFDANGGVFEPLFDDSDDLFVGIEFYLHTVRLLSHIVLYHIIDNITISVANKSAPCYTVLKKFFRRQNHASYTDT